MRCVFFTDEVKDFFEIMYTKPGRMSAGMTCAINITFHPKVNKDIIVELPFLVQHRTAPHSTAQHRTAPHSTA